MVYDPLKAKTDPLTPRETEILRLIATGLTDPEIGRALNVSPRTVRTHNSSMLSKLGARNRVEATLAAQRMGLTGSCRNQANQRVETALCEGLG